MASTSIATVYPPMPGKDALNQEQKQAAQEVFRENIRTRQPVIQEYVRTKMASHKSLRDLCYYPRRVKQVVKIIDTNADTHPEPPVSISTSTIHRSGSPIGTTSLIALRATSKLGTKKIRPTWNFPSGYSPVFCPPTS